MSAPLGWARFRRDPRGWIPLWLVLGAFVATFFLPLLVNDRALAVRHDGQLWLPVLHGYVSAEALGQREIGEARYRPLRDAYAADGGGDWVWLAPYPYGPVESLLGDPSVAESGPPPHAPSAAHWLGTDDRGRDVLARLLYGFRISFGFGLVVLAASYALGIAVGAALGWTGGAVDLVGQRLVEIWSGLPFLYTVIIVTSLVQPSVGWLALVLSLFQWMGISYYVRAEVLRERGKEYVLAAVAQGKPHWRVLGEHVLPNALTSVLAFAPFALIAHVTALVQLDYLGFGLPAPTPSWGELIGQGLATREWHLVVFPVGALFVALLLVVLVGDALREAYDPRGRS